MQPGRSDRAPEDAVFYIKRQLSGLLFMQRVFDCSYSALRRRLYLKEEQIFLCSI